MSRWSEERIGLERFRAFEALACCLARHVKQERWNAGIGKVGRDLRTHRSRADHGSLTYVPHHLPNPPTNRSTTASASPASEYRRRLRIQFVAISSSAPKNTFAAIVGLISLRNAPLSWPSSMMSRM